MCEDTRWEEVSSLTASVQGSQPERRLGLIWERGLWWVRSSTAAGGSRPRLTVAIGYSAVLVYALYRYHLRGDKAPVRTLEYTPSIHNNTILSCPRSCCV
jgi:hypothetical protein